MKKRIFILLFTLVVVALVLFKEWYPFDLTRGEWKYVSGNGSIGDVVNFSDATFRASNDTIYRGEEAVAVVLSVSEKKLYIQRLNDGADAEYRNRR